MVSHNPTCEFFPSLHMAMGIKTLIKTTEIRLMEVEYKNRNPTDMRKNGHRLMKSPYNSLYLAAKIYGPDLVDGKTEAAILLWGRTGTGGGNNDDDNIKVIEAVSFGTKDLSEISRRNTIMSSPSPVPRLWLVLNQRNGDGPNRSRRIIHTSQKMIRPTTTT
jgi:hypothetical protein